MTDSISFDLGALAPHIGEQIPQLPSKRALEIEGHRRSINMLRIHGILTRAEAKRAELRLVKSITSILKGGDT